MSEWKPTTLGSIVSIKHGWPFKSECFVDSPVSLPIAVSIGNFQYTGGFRFNTTDLKYYSGSYPKEYELSPGDILLIMTCQTAGGEILGIPGKIPDDGRKYLHNQRMGLVLIKNNSVVDKDFLYWLFLSKDFNQELCASSTGTKIVHTAPSRIEAYKFLLPPLPEQQAIARILGSLDDKIELNRQMNHTLETMAQTLFKSWFVDFDPVVAKSEGRKPYGMTDEVASLFPSKLVESELGMIPEGWSWNKLQNIVKNFDNQRIPLSSAQRSSRKGIYPYYGAASILDHVNDYIYDGVFLLLGEDGSVVTQDGFPILQYVWGKFWVNNHAHVLQGKSPYTVEYLYLLLSKTSISHIVTGAVQPKINQANLNSIDCIVADSHIVSSFQRLIMPFFSRIQLNSEENLKISLIRDTLLPKLISGDIRIKDAEKLVERHI